VFPTHGAEAAVFLMLPVAEAGRLLHAGNRRTQVWLDFLRDAAPDLAERIDAGSVRGPVRGTVALPNHVRRAAGRGWALVGDAGYHRDPITAHGMTDAFRDAELLANAAHRLLLDPSDERAAMTAYEQQRDAALAPTFALTREHAAFPAVERFVELGRIVDDLAVCGLDAGNSHHILGESLGALDAGGVGRRPEAGDTCCAHRVGDTEDQRNLGPDDDEVGVDLLGQRGNRVTRGDVDGVLLGDFCDPGIARRADQGRDTWIASK